MAATVEAFTVYTKLFIWANVMSSTPAIALVEGGTCGSGMCAAG